ncbi:MAG: ATP-dependent DNA helicase RecQ [Deltaproteobacteria bacterium]|nr:ATP-dependent DNA helicase RecQ [Deltaproteobacteria bacterium]
MLVLHAPCFPAMPPLPTDLDEVLRTRFQLASFRPWQREAIDALLGAPGKVLVVAPTGGGKSLTYQLPATVLPGVTLVISPLVALMEDQVRALEARGVPAAFLASTLGIEERRARIREAHEGKLKLLYCAPERLASDWFVDFLASCDVSMVAIDEAHCISHWGHDFRPDYLRIGDVLARLRPSKVLACTATATPRVREEIRARLGLDGAHEVLRGFARPNLHLEAKSVEGPREAKAEVLAALERALGPAGSPRAAAIVYCATRRATEQMAADLTRAGHRAEAYHAGLPADVRADVNARFATGALPIVAATNAFGMGIDRADVRVVVHAQPPASLEAYYQEVGRAGRDGDESFGLLLCSASDVQLRRRLCELGTDGPAAPEAAARAWGLFRELLRYLDARTCRHDFILRYFGDEREVLGGCGHCDVCEALDDEGELEDLGDEAATEVRKALAGVARVKQRAGMIAVAEMLRGDKSARVERFGFDQLSTFGLLSNRTQTWTLSLLRALLAAGWIDLTPTEHPVPFVTEPGWKVMTGSGPIRLRLPVEVVKEKRARRERRGKRELEAAAGDAPLFEALRACRAEIARGRRVPAYVVANDATLLAIAQRRPLTEGDLLAVPGMGPYRVETYGDAFLDVVRQQLH